MRKEKFANVLKDHPADSLEDIISLLDETKELSRDEFVEEDTKEAEYIEKLDKLSLTREIKYKDIQEQIDIDEKAATQEIVLTDIPKKRGRKPKKTTEEVINQLIKEEVIEEDNIPIVDESILEEKPKKKKTRNKKEEIPEEAKEEIKDDEVTITKIDLKKINELDDVDVDKDLEKTLSDDIYLTTSFKPPKKRLKRIFKKILAFLIINSLLFCLVYFFIYPLYKKITITPNEIFNKNIDTITNNINSYIDYDVLYNDLSNANIKTTLQTNDKKLTNITNLDINISTTKDYEKKESSISLSLEDYENTVGFNFVNKDNVSYYKSLEGTTYIELKNEYQNPLQNIHNISKEEIKYITEKNNKVLKEILSSYEFTKENDTININGKETRVSKISLKLDQSTMTKLTNEYNAKILSDNKYVSIMSRLTNTTETEYKKMQQSTIYETTYKGSINLYVKNIDEFVGIDIEQNGFRSLYYYISDDYIDLYVNLGTNENVKAYEIVATKENNKDKLVIKQNSKEILILYINNLQKDKINISYEELINHTTGELILEKNKITFTINKNSNYYKFDMKIQKNNNSIELNKTKKETDKLFIEENNKIIDILKEMDIKKEIEYIVSEINENTEYNINYPKEEVEVEQDTEEDEENLE